MDPFQRPALAAGIKAKGHRGAGAQRRADQVIGIGAGAQPARFDRLVDQKTGLPDMGFDLKAAAAGLADRHHIAGQFIAAHTFPSHQAAPKSPVLGAIVK